MILGIVPGAYTFFEVKKDDKTTLHIRRRQADATESSSLTDRIRTFCDAINKIVRVNVEDMMKEFPDIEDDDLQAALDLIDIEKATITVVKQENQRKKRILGLENKDKKDADQHTKIQEALAKPVPTELKSLPKWLIDKVPFYPLAIVDAAIISCA